jgi:hypothetical protein
VTASKDSVQKSLHQLLDDVSKYNLTISTSQEEKTLAMKGKELRTKTAVNNNIFKQGRNFNYLGSQSASKGNLDVKNKSQRFSGQ